MPAAQTTVVCQIAVQAWSACIVKVSHTLQSKCSVFLKMATTKHRKVAEECRSFQERCTKDLFFVQINGKPACLVFGGALGVTKKVNLEHQSISKHAKLNELRGQMWQDKISALQQSLESQQATFTRSRDSHIIIQASSAVSQLIARKRRPRDLPMQT